MCAVQRVDAILEEHDLHPLTPGPEVEIVNIVADADATGATG